MYMAETIVCYGDSNTYGYDPRSFMGERYPKEIRWTGLLEKHTGWEIRNCGVNGRCIPHDPSQIRFALEQARGWRRENYPVWLWIMLGTNDLLTEPGFTAWDVAARMENFLELLLSQTGEGELPMALIVPPPLEYGAWVNEERLYRESRKLEEAYKKTAEKLGIGFVPTKDWEISLVFDGVHFSEKGHKRFAEKILETVKK